MSMVRLGYRVCPKVELVCSREDADAIAAVGYVRSVGRIFQRGVYNYAWDFVNHTHFPFVYYQVNKLLHS